MFFEFKIWKKDKVTDRYYTGRFSFDVIMQQVCYIETEYIYIDGARTKCSKIEFTDGKKVLAVDQHTAFKNFLDKFTETAKPTEGKSTEVNPNQ